MTKPKPVIRSLSEQSIEKLSKRIKTTSWSSTYRACQVSEDTFRRAMNGGSLSESSHRLITALAKEVL